MRIPCECGFNILDRTDDVAEKAHVIPDQEWFATSSAIIDQVIEPLSRGELELNRARLLTCIAIGRRQLIAYQCPKCGRLYIGKLDGQLHCFVPAHDHTSRSVFRVRDGE